MWSFRHRHGHREKAAEEAILKIKRERRREPDLVGAGSAGTSSLSWWRSFMDMDQSYEARTSGRNDGGVGFYCVIGPEGFLW